MTMTLWLRPSLIAFTRVPCIKTIRCFSISRPMLVHEVKKKVKPYGKLLVNLPWNVEIKPTDPHDYPDMDALLLKISSTGSLADIEDVLVMDVDDDVWRIRTRDGTGGVEGVDVRCLIEAPIQYDVDAKARNDSEISIAGMLSNVIDVETERGNITGAKLQAKKMIFHCTQGGSIHLRKSLQGDIEMITAKDGSIKAEKCLGTNLRMTTQNGDISIGSNYCEKATFATVNGKLELDNLHMDANVNVSGSGSLNVSCLDGSLQAKLQEGDAKIHVVRLTGISSIISGGFVHLIVPRENNNIKLNLKSPNTNFDDSLGCAQRTEDGLKTSGEIALSVKTMGNIQVTGSSWAESLQFGKFSK